LAFSDEEGSPDAPVQIYNQTSTGHLATLYEPVITGLGNGRMTFRGIERMESEDGVTGYAQEWRVEVD
jgi:hypothetical protein